MEKEEFLVKVEEEVYGPIPLDRIINDVKSGDLTKEATFFDNDNWIPVSLLLEEKIPVEPWNEDDWIDNKEDLLIGALVERIKKEKIEEVILATSTTIEGQTTAFYIQDSLKQTNIKVSKLAQGLPVGGEIESLDDGTLFSAFKNRKNFGES